MRIKSIYPKFLKLPTVVELGKSTYNALPSRRFDKFEEGYCWEDYEAEMKEQYPFKYFLNYTFSTWFSVHIIMVISNWWYWVKSFLFRRDHLLDLRQPKDNEFWGYRWGYLDPCQKVLLANFSILVDYVENEKVYNPADHYSEEELQNDPAVKTQYEDYLEVLALYKYWTEGAKESADNSTALYKKMNEQEDKEKNEEIREVWLEAHKKCDEDEQEALVRLIKIRKGLWS